MPQDRESGAAGREYGLRTGRGLAKLMGLKKLSGTSNEVVWNGQPAVIKACNPGTSSIGITASMLPRLETVLVAVEDDHRRVQVWALPATRFRADMYDSRSTGSVGGRVKMLARSIITQEGRPIGRYGRVEIDAAARD